jgi:PAS domain S-box-containing protein
MTKEPDIKDLAQWVEERTARLLEINKKLKTEITERRRAEKALRESEERYRLAVEHSNDGFALSEQGRIMYVNQRFMQIFGYRQEQDVINQRISSFIHPDDRQWVEDNYNRRQRGEAAPSRYEFKGIRKDGRVIYIEVSSTKSSFHGRPVNLAYLRDITDRKLAKEALLESELRFRLSFENAAIGMIMADLNGRLLEVNPSMCAMLGYSEAELLKINIKDLTHPDDHERDIQKHRQLLRGETPYVRLEKRYIHKNGESIWGMVSCSIIRDADGSPLYLVAQVQNVTQQKTAQEELRKSEERYRNLFENTGTATFVVDEDMTIIKVNAKCLELSGYTREEIEGKLKTVDFVAEQDVEKIKQYHFGRREKNSRVPSEYEFKFVDKYGQEKDVIIQTGMIAGTQKSIESITDISARKRIEEQRKTLEAQLQQAQKMEAIGTLAGGIAHDFNNLLMGIQGNTSLALLDIDSSHPNYERLKSIQSHVQNATALTRQLLGFARGGKYEVRPTDLNLLIRHNAHMFGRTRKEIAIHTKFEKNLWTVEVDESQIDQVLLNFYVNAWQAMPQGGKLFIQTANIELDEKSITPFHLQPGKFVKISVADTGVGMDETTRQRIFEPFFTTKKMGRGTGLGLASAYGIIQNHGGFIDVHSSKGQGANFDIYLPVSPKKVVTQEKPPPVRVDGNEMILLIDDEDMIVDIGRQILKTLGYRTITAGSGQDAIECFKKRRNEIDLVILDMIMPDMNGEQTYLNLKRLDPDVKVLLSSGYSIDGQAAKIMQQGCNGFIQKPFHLQHLSTKIREILDKG